MKGNRPGISFWERWEEISRQYAFGIISTLGFEHGMAGLRLHDRKQALEELKMDYAAKRLSQEHYENRLLSLNEIFADADEEWDL